MVELSGIVQQRENDVGEHVSNARGDDLRRDSHLHQALGHMSTVALERGGTQCRPDEPFGQIRIAGIERSYL